MSALVVCYEHEKELNDINSALNRTKEWDLHYFDASKKDVQFIEKEITESEAEFLICSKNFSKDIVQNLNQLYLKNPLLTIIYFFSVLKESEYAELHRAGIRYCFVGSARKSNLQMALDRLSKHHWKKIPESIYETKYDELPPRAKRILKYIENAPIKYCNIENISNYLTISQSHFRKEFKKYFGLPFRQFKQDLILHYEDILLFEKKLKPRHIFSVLDYKNLSAFSRSFKSRHGSSWQTVVKSFN